MKRLYLILTAITVLALAAMSCGIQFVGSTPTPTPAPQGPIPQNFDPGPGPDNGNPVPQGPGPQGPEPQNGNPVPQGPGPNPNGGNPGQGDIQFFTADQMTLKKGECTNLHWQTQGGFQANLNGQPVPAVGQQQVCPTQSTLYRLGLDIGNQILTREVTITVSGSDPGPVITVPANNNNPGGNNGNDSSKDKKKGKLDFQAKDMYLDKGNYVHIGVKNNSTQSGDLYFAVSCTGKYHLTKNGSKTNVTYSSNSVTATFNPNQERWTNTKILLDKGVGFYDLTCTISSPFDPDPSNNTITKTLEVLWK